MSTKEYISVSRLPGGVSGPGYFVQKDIDVKKLTGSTLANIIVVIAVAVIPLMYAGLLTSAYQNPTNRVYTIQAAVVNEDVATDVVLATGSTEHFALGDELEDRLTSPQDGEDVGFTWHSMSAEQAAADMKDEKIRAVLTIPADFSASTTKVGTTDAAAAAQQTLDLRTDDGINYLAGTLARTVAVNLEDELTAKGAEKYTDNILLSIGTIRSGMEDAQSGAEQLTTGADALQSGLDTLAEGTTTAASGAGQLAEGAGSAATGATQAASGSSALASGVSRLGAGASTLSGGVDRYTAGVDRAAAGANSLAGGVTTYTKGVDSAAAGAQQLAGGAQGLTALNSGVVQYTGGVDQLRVNVVKDQGSTPSLVTGVNALATGTQKLAATIDTAAAAIGEPGAPAVDPSSISGSTPLTTAMATLVASAGSADPASGPTGLVKGVSDYTGGTTAYVDATIGAVKTQMDAACAAEPNGETCAQLAAAYKGGQSLLAQANPLKQAASGVGQLARAVEDQGVTPLAAQMQAANDSSSAESVPALNAGAHTLAERVGSATDVYDPSTGAGQTVAGVLNTLSSQSPALRTGASQATRLIGGTAQLDSGLSTLSSNSSTLRAGVDQLNSGTQQLSGTSSSLRSGASQLASGAAEASDGADTLTVGLRELSDGTTTLASKTGELATGLDTLDRGAQKAAEGTTALSTGITKLSDGLSDGVDRIPDYSEQDSAHIASVISKPVSVDPVRENAVANNGAGFTPMFMSLALWVGGIAIFLVLPALDRRPSPTERWWMAPVRPAVTATLMGVAQAVLLMVLTNWLVGLEAVDVSGLILLAIASSLTFVALNQMLVATLAYRGRFVSIVFLCLQITSMGATFPIETAPKFFQWIHPWLPMSYTQLAFREMLAGAGATHAVRNCLLVLALYFALAVVLTFVAAHLRSGARPLPSDNALLGDSLAAAAEADRASARVRAQMAREDPGAAGTGESGPTPASA
ncbi:YhgE/Pip domain-containing protein [Actinomyces sp.]|uniref:YhgE/Pip domain-containing protein n=1 Tax=Actinomyces sp. TaxID=29317 RepID=UPI0028A29E1E|nr:YhgE/Pip domain-containing protein [Actinomyces sp.]